jgi:DNA-binding CsgD family transcriptional regulator
MVVQDADARLRQLFEASLALTAELSVDALLQKLVETAAELIEAAPDDLDVQAGAWGRARALLSLSEADWRRAGEELDRAMEFVRRSPTVELPFRGLWALIKTVEGAAGDAARDEVRSSLGMALLLNRVCLECAEAIAVARGGDKEAATRRFEAALAEQARLQEGDWLRYVITWLVARSGIDDGWGSPTSWLRPALAYFEARGLDRLATSCRGLLRRAGAPVPRKGRGASEVPPALAAMGVTTREMDVLSLVAEGLTNRQIGERLHLSERTVEKHVASLLVRLGLQRRVQLAGAWLRATSGPGLLSG